MRVRWSKSAVDHLISIYEYIASDSPFYAQRTVDKLTRRSEQIGMFPLSGRMVPEYEHADIREVIEGSYRIIYRVGTDEVVVLTVVHGAMRLKPGD